MLKPENTPTVRPAAILYFVALPGKPAAEVRATKRGAEVEYFCGCAAYALWNECEHVRAVAAERASQGRAH